MENFDLIVIGSGPAGYTGAIRAAQLGMKVACIDKRKTLGGTCLNVGCIPSKALLNYSEKFHEVKNNYENFGIKTSATLDLKVMMQRKDQTVSELCKGIDMLMGKNKITKLTGSAQIISANEVKITDNDQAQTLTCRHILIATGSEANSIDGVEIDEISIVSSTGALALKEVPKHLVVIGGGYIGLELGSVWKRLGSKVTVVEYADKITPSLDSEVGANFMKILQKQGFEFKLSTKIASAKKSGKIISLELHDLLTNNQSTLEADVVLVAAGRRPFTSGLGLAELGINISKNGCIEVNEHFQTNHVNIYAVGDVIAGPMLAHKAEEEAVAAVEIMAGKAGHVNYSLIPSVVYTYPEVAQVGYTEEQLKAKNITYKIGKFPFLANSRAKSIGASEGFVKILADAVTDQVLGAHIIGPEAGTLIGEMAAYMTFSAAAEDIARTCHSHPTLNEAIKEAALAVDKRTINF